MPESNSTTSAASGKPRSWRDYKETCELLVDQLGKRRLISDMRPDDFAALRKVMTKKWGLHQVANNVQNARSVFKHAFEVELIATPIRFGPGFKLPSKKSFPLEKAKQGEKLYTRREVRAMLDATDGPLHAIVPTESGLTNRSSGR
jgi:hypothetical protein